MVTLKFEGQIDSYQGRNLADPIKYSGSVEGFSNKEEAVTATKWPGDADILEMLNGRLLTSEKAKSYQSATKALKEAYEASPDFKRKQLINAAVEAGFSPAEAEALAESKLGK